MSKVVDISGRRFGKLVALSRSHQDTLNRWLWHCQCDCGAQTVVSSNNLRTGNTQSCGCVNKQRKSVFGRLVTRHRGSSHYRWVSDRTKVGRRDGTDARKWVADALMANGRICMKCGTAENLHVHHADAWGWCPNRRFDNFNAVILCAYHHREFHRLYGRDGVRQEQVHEYLGYPPIEREVIDIQIERPDDEDIGRIFDFVMKGEREKAFWLLTREIKRREATE